MAQLHRKVKRRLSDVASDTASIIQDGAKQMRRLLLWTELPEWQQEDNKYIESGYRYVSPGVREGSMNSCHVGRLLALIDSP